MSNSIGKAKEHEKWERMKQENKLRPKITTRILSDEDIRHDVLVATKGIKVTLRNLPYVLHLPVGNWSRLNEIVVELEHEGKVRILNLPEGKTIEATS